MCADGTHPLPGILLAPVAGGEEDLPAGGLQGHGHGLVPGAAVAGLREMAEVVLQEVHAPGSEGFRVRELVVVAGGIARAGHDAGAGIHAELQAFGVDIVRQVLHAVGELFRIRNEEAVFVPLAEGPAVVDDQVLIAGGQPAVVHHEVRGFADQGVADIGAEGVPGIPAERGEVCKHGGSSFRNE